jgi:hypothetical protein
MLAYMDGLLEPADAEDIGKKIEESETAGKIYHRVRDCMRRLRLGAPGLTDRGPGLDPNTVAEYLDNILPADRVPDFEKVCLEAESDVQLAEVASCHQILTLVLGEAAEIDPASRQRMYQLPEVAARAEAENRRAAVAASVATGDGAGGGDGAPRRSRPKPTVPEYLRESAPRRRHLLQNATWLALAGCFLAVVLLALGQFEEGTLLGNLVRRLGVYREVARGEAESPPAEKNTATADAKQELLPDTDANAKREPAGKSPPARPATQSAKTPAPTEKQGRQPVREPPPVAPLPPGVATAEDSKPAAPKPAGSTPPAQALAKAEPPLPGAMSPKAETKPPAAEPASKAEPPLFAPAGQFLAESEDLLLRFDAPTSAWYRVLPKETLVSHYRLLALPTHRPRVLLTGGAEVDLLGGTQLELLPESGKAPAGVEVAFGRIVIRPRAPQARLSVTTAEHGGIMTLADAEAVAALDVLRIHLPGTNPEKEPPQVIADLYVSGGDVSWEEGGQAAVELKAPARIRLGQAIAPAGSAPSEKDMPKWIAADAISPLDRQASPTLDQALQAGRPAGMGLLELTDHRRKEVRWLAMRSLEFVDNFEPIVAALNEPSRKPDWPDYVDQLRQAVARGPEHAAAIRKTMEKQFGDDAGDLYRMLWGYTDKDLQDGADRQLVKLLSHDTLALRVLAHWNLKDITGLGLYYRPEQTAAIRQSSTLRWEQRQKAGEIRLKATDDKSRPAAEPAAAAEKPAL